MATCRVRGPTHQRKGYEIDEGHDDGDQERFLPLGGDGVQGGDEKVAAEVEHIQGGRQRTPQLWLAHLAAIRYAQAGREARAQAHQHGARVQNVYRDREHDHDHHRQELDEIGERHARPVTQVRLDQ